MKNYIIAAVVLLLIVFLCGAAWSFTSPAEVIAQKKVKVLDFTQQGNFDYSVTAKPNYFYDNVLPATPVTSPMIPIKFIQNMTFNYSYHSDSASSPVIYINAILQSPGAWQKTVPLTTQKDSSGNSDVSFSLNLKSLQDLADTINKEIGVQSSSYNLTLQAVVSNGNAPDFIQLLPVNMTDAYIKIGDNLVQTGDGSEGRFDYQVKLADNSLFGAVTLTSPPAPTSVLDIVLSPTDTVFTKFIDNMQFSYNYQFTSSQPVNGVTSSVEIDAVLGNPKVWTKTYTLIPPTQKDGNFTLSFPLDINQYSSIFDTIQQETGVSASTEDLTLQATVHTTAQSSGGIVDKVFTQSITTNLKSGILTWDSDLNKSQTGDIEAPQLVTSETRILGLPVLWIRIASAALSAVLLIVLGIYLFVPKPKITKLALAEAQSRQINKKYKDLIVEVTDRPETGAGQTVLTVVSLQELIKVSQGLLKPVNHNAVDGSHVYWVYDDSTRYEYIIDLNGVHAGEARIEKEGSGPQKETKRVE